MGFYAEQIVPRLTYLTMRSEPLGKIRAKTLSGVRGVVLEAGFGSGLNLPHYPAGVSRVLAVEPSPVARKIAAPAIAAAPFDVDFVGLDGQRISLDDKSVDFVVTTWTLCTIPDAAVALNEFARVLRVGGQFVFAEHGLAPDSTVARWQNRLNGAQRRLAGGCNLNRKIDDLIGASPLLIKSLKQFYMPGLKTHSYLYMGSAARES